MLRMLVFSRWLWTAIVIGLAVFASSCARSPGVAADLPSAENGIYLQHLQAKIGSYAGSPVEWVRYYLVPAEFAAVQQALMQAIPSEGRAGSWEDASAELSTLDSGWIETAVSRRPEVRATLRAIKAAWIMPIIDEASAKGAVHPSEVASFHTMLQDQIVFSDEVVEQAPIARQRIARWWLRRAHGRFQTEVGLMDVAPMLGLDPMTLIWSSGRQIETSHEFKLGISITGVTGIPFPHFERSQSVHLYRDPALEATVSAVARTFNALNTSDATAFMERFERYYSPEALPPVRDGRDVVDLQWSILDLPAGEPRRSYHDTNWRLLALPDGSALITGWDSYRYTLNDGSVQRTRIDAQFNSNTKGVRIDRHGVVWGFVFDDNQYKLVSWSSDRGLRLYPLEEAGLDFSYIKDWTVLPESGVAILAHNGIFTMTPGARAFRVIPSGGKRLRADVIDAMGPALPPRAWSSALRLDDGLLWAADVFLYALSPSTGTVASSVPASVGNLFFGSIEAGWAIAQAHVQGHDVYRVADLASGKARYDIETGAVSHPASVARTANGRLLALSGSSRVTVVFDMASGRAVGGLRVPPEYEVEDTAFSWSGDRLWAYLRKIGGTNDAKLAVWDVPPDLRDAASGGTYPDQVRCTITISSCE